MRYLLLLCPLLLIMAGKPLNTEKWIVFKGCTLKVTGSTNINKFSCSVADYSSPDTLLFYKCEDKILVHGCLELPVFNFDCLNNGMTADLRKTLKAKDFPHLNIRFLSLKKYPELKSIQEDLTGAVCIELAGTTRKMDINYHIYMDEQQVIHLVGEQRFRFSDFNLVPPKKLGGMIRANDELDVQFQINFKLLQ